MNATQRELLRTEIMRIAGNAAPNAVTLRILAAYLRGLLTVTEPELLAEVQYLVGKGLLDPAPKLLSPENKAWLVTAMGRDWLAEQGLE